jgi:hypothetical protein
MRWVRIATSILIGNAVAFVPWLPLVPSWGLDSNGCLFPADTRVFSRLFVRWSRRHGYQQNHGYELRDLLRHHVPISSTPGEKEESRCALK